MRVDEQPDAARLAAWRAFLEAHAALVDVLEAELQAAHDLALSWYDVLVQLSEAPEHCLRMQDLARSVLLSKSGLTRLFDRMEEAGLVERRPFPGDRRGTLAALTDAGMERLRRAAPAHLAGVQRHFAGYLSDDEAATLTATFHRIRAALPGAQRSDDG